MRSCVKDVDSFHKKAGIHLPENPVTCECRQLALSLVIEEFFELLSGHDTPLEDCFGVTYLGEAKTLLKELKHQRFSGWSSSNDEAVADAIIDLIVVLIRMGLAYGYPLEALWDEVHRANMDKVRDRALLRADGKILKPEGWTPPDIKGILRRSQLHRGEPAKVIERRYYKHYKGGTYYVHFVSTHSETGTKMVCYSSSTSRHWVRPLDMFLEHVFVDGIEVPRFQLITDGWLGGEHP